MIQINKIKCIKRNQVIGKLLERNRQNNHLKSITMTFFAMISNSFLSLSCQYDSLKQETLLDDLFEIVVFEHHFCLEI